MPTDDPSATPTDHVTAIERLGYTPREAAFLARVVTAGGYFTRAQFAQALGIRRGGTDADFGRRLVNRGHATVQLFCDTTQVFHLTAAGLWADQPGASPRQRRPRPALAIKARLMALDLVLALPHVDFALDHLARLRVCDEAGVPRTEVPRRDYRPRGAAEPATRHLPDTPLIGLTTQPTAAPALVLGYVDDGAQTQAGFQTFLRRHTSMLAAARRWTVVYACESPRQAAAAEQTFRRVLEDDPARDAARGYAEALDYCELRQLYDRQLWSQLDTARIQRYLGLKQRLGALGDPAFATWQSGGEAALIAWLTVAPIVRRGHLDTLVLTRGYATFEARRNLR